MSNRFSIWLCSFLIPLLMSAHAFGGVMYSESIDGDLPAATADLPIFEFGIGSNTISGTLWIQQRPDLGYDLDGDRFIFQIPLAAQLDAITLKFNDAQADFVSSTWSLRPGIDPGAVSGDPGFFSSTQSIPSPSTYLWPLIPLGSGVYNFASVGAGQPATTSASADYIANFEVSAAVPEPSSAVMLGVLSLICGLSRSRRRRQ